MGIYSNVWGKPSFQVEALLNKVYIAIGSAAGECRMLADTLGTLFTLNFPQELQLAAQDSCLHCGVRVDKKRGPHLL